MGSLPTICAKMECYRTAVLNGRCRDHQLPAFAGNFRSSRLPSDWKNRREIVMNRDKGICYLCGDPGADSVDHVNQSMDDDHSLDNLAAVHDMMPPHCHKRKTAMEGVEARKGNMIKKNFNQYDSGSSSPF